MADDHAVKAISSYSADLIDTPNIDRLAREGARFQNAFVTNSICSPSRAVLLTGKHSHINGLRDNRDIFDGSQVTFPKLLQESGYQTAIVGKWHLKSDPTGFDFWQILIDQGEYYSPQFRSSEGTTQYDGAYVTDKITDIALSFLESRDSTKPFALLYHHKAPHRNWMPAPKFLDEAYEREFPLPESFDDDYEGRPAAAAQDMKVADMFLSWDMKLPIANVEDETESGGGRGRSTAATEAVDGWKAAFERLSSDQKVVWESYLERVNANYEMVKNDAGELARWKYQRYMNDYLGTIRSIDENIGRVLDYLDQNGLSENTIVVYTSDQGFYLGEHGWYDKRFMYEESMRTPLLIRFPEEIRAGLIVQKLVQNLDFAPTLLDLTTGIVPADMQGLSLRPLLDEAAQAKWRTSLYYHYYEYPHGWHSVHPHYGVRTERYKLIHFYGEMDHWELYDLMEDPDELDNLYDDSEYAAVRTDLQDELRKLRLEYNDQSE